MLEAVRKLEVRAPEPWGISPVPLERRRMRPFDFAILWGDLAVSLLVMVAGSLLVPGLSTKEALLAIIVGNIVGTAFLAVAGLVGSSTGVPTMVSLRATLGIRGSFVPSLLNILQLVGWAALEIIVMAQAARALSERYLDFSGYYFWIAFFGVTGTIMALGGPVAVVRIWMQRFGVWVVIAATLWLTLRLFDVYDMDAIWRRAGEGGFPNFWQGVDLVVALPVSWLPLVGDYSRFARRGPPAAAGTYVGYVIANIWFFALGMLYVQALETTPLGFIDALVTMLLPLAAGWLALLVLLAAETDEAFANIYSTAVSLRNLVPKVSHGALAVAVGLAAMIVAASIDLLQYENFLLLIGGVFVPLFGILFADFFVVGRGRYEVADLYEEGGRYWFHRGFNAAALIAWLLGFLAYAHAAQPPWLLENADFVSWAPAFVGHVGGTVPGFLLSFAVYLALRRLMRGRALPARPEQV